MYFVHVWVLCCAYVVRCMQKYGLYYPVDKFMNLKLPIEHKIDINESVTDFCYSFFPFKNKLLGIFDKSKCVFQNTALEWFLRLHQISSFWNSNFHRKMTTTKNYSISQFRQSRQLSLHFQFYVNNKKVSLLLILFLSSCLLYFPKVFTSETFIFELKISCGPTTDVISRPLLNGMARYFFFLSRKYM